MIHEWCDLNYTIFILYNLKYFIWGSSAIWYSLWVGRKLCIYINVLTLHNYLVLRTTQNFTRICSCSMKLISFNSFYNEIISAESYIIRWLLFLWREIYNLRVVFFRWDRKRIGTVFPCCDFEDCSNRYSSEVNVKCSV